MNRPTGRPPLNCSFSIVHDQSTPEILVVSDLSPSRGGMSITNDAGNLVRWLVKLGHLTPGRKLAYYDTEGHCDEIEWDRAGNVWITPGDPRTRTIDNYSPMETAIAMALYAYNVSAITRAVRLRVGNPDIEPSIDLTELLHKKPHLAATELSFSTAALYVRQALEAYGPEARTRVTIELKKPK